MNLTKRALVTGSSGAIGAAIAQQLAADGYHLLVHANANRQAADGICAQIKKNGGSAEVVVFDVTQADDCANAIAALLADQAIQILVNNAGIHDDVPFAGMSPEAWHSVVDVSLHGFYNVTRPLIMEMMRSRWGRIINVSSIAAISGNRGQVNYSAAKAALHGATKSLALELASRGITVNAVAPGIIESDMSKSSFTIDQIKQLVPMQRAGKPEEIAALVSFLVSEQAAYLSGQVIAVNGAMPIG